MRQCFAPLLLAMLLGLCLSISACGKKGSLYLPEPPAEQSQQQNEQDKDDSRKPNFGSQQQPSP